MNMEPFNKGYSYHSLLSYIYLKKFIKLFNIYSNIPIDIVYYISKISLLLERWIHPSNRCKCSFLKHECFKIWPNLIDKSKLYIDQQIIHCRNIYVYSIDSLMFIQSTCHHIYLKKDGNKKCNTCENVPFDKITKFKQKYYSNTKDIVI
jgi:hypothetical protein